MTSRDTGGALRVTEAGAIALEAATDELCALDSVAGDGDHGFAMGAAAKSIRRRLAERPAAPTPQPWSGSWPRSSARSAARWARCCRWRSTPWATRPPPWTSRCPLGRSRRTSETVCEALTEFGGAKVGDKTIVDAVASAHAAAAAAADQGADAAETLSAAAAGANAGAESTADMIAQSAGPVGSASGAAARSTPERARSPWS